ncbi:MAG: GNAT family N-acetyltransferase [Planctomycetota bacterium]|nr:GNAT family N-acetyltransferase [Planctomycetota bacterium]
MSEMSGRGPDLRDSRKYGDQGNTTMSFIIETERLGMREFGPEDADDFFALCTNPQVMKYIGGEDVPANVEAMRDKIVAHPDYKRHGFGRWACIHKATGRLIGFTGLKRLEDFGGDVDLGYRFLPEFWRQGLATESGLPCIRYGFEVLGLDRIIGLAIPENVASVRVLEKCGMTFERFVDDPQAGQVALYSILLATPNDNE